MVEKVEGKQGVTFELGGIEEIQSCLCFDWQYFEKNEQKDYFHSYNTDVVVAYKNVVIYIVVNTYIIVVYIGNISPAGS